MPPTASQSFLRVPGKHRSESDGPVARPARWVNAGVMKRAIPSMQSNSVEEHAATLTRGLYPGLLSVTFHLC